VLSLRRARGQIHYANCKTTAPAATDLDAPIRLRHPKRVTDRIAGVSNTFLVTHFKEIAMKVKHLFAVTAIALAPFAANADQGDKYLEQLLGTSRSTLTVAAVRMQANTPYFGEKHLVDTQYAERSLLTRAEVQRRLVAGTIERGGA
jgi:hypothetical protein